MIIIFDITPVIFCSKKNIKYINAIIIITIYVMIPMNGWFNKIIINDMK